MTRLTIPLLCLLLLALPAVAQENPGDSFVDNPLSFGQQVGDDITEDAIFDWWRIEVVAGDVIGVTMTGADGLAPLVGVLDPTRELVARSDDGDVNGQTALTFTAEQSGEHIVVATRVGNLDGTTTGSYTLLAERLQQAVPERENPYAPVVLPCGDEAEMSVVLQFQLFEDQAEVDAYLISVVGLDGFSPAIHLQIEEPLLTDCSQDANQMPGDTFTLPGEAPFTLPDDVDETNTAAQLRINSPDQLGPLEITIGSVGGTPGRYVLVVQGFRLAAGDSDSLDLRLGPLARDTDLRLYMVGTGEGRFDPLLRLLPEEDGVTCDDAGRRGCEAIESFDGAGADIRDWDGDPLRGDRFDAGLLLQPGNTDPFSVELTTVRDDTAGDYALVFIGELPE